MVEDESPFEYTYCYGKCGRRIKVSEATFHIMGWSFVRLSNGSWGSGAPCSLMYCEECTKFVGEISKKHHDSMNGELLSSMGGKDTTEREPKPLPKVGHAS